MLEALPLLFVMFILLGVTLGLWGVVHSATLNSIASRNYLFFRLNNRSEILFLNDTDRIGGNHYYRPYGQRFFFISSESATGTSTTYATTRRPDFRTPASSYSGDSEILSNPDHTDLGKGAFTLPRRNEDKKVGPVWIMVGYGICLNAGCGGP